MTDGPFDSRAIANLMLDDLSDDRRAVRLHADEGAELYSREELEQMVTSTYEM
jgi:hypothetical protein